MTAVWVWTHGRSVSASLVNPALTRSGLIKIDAIHVLTGLKAPHETRPTRHGTHFLSCFLVFFKNKWRLCTACWISLDEMRKGARLAEHGFHASHLSLSTHGVAFGSVAAQTSAPVSSERRRRSSFTLTTALHPLLRAASPATGAKVWHRI